MYRKATIKKMCPQARKLAELVNSTERGVRLLKKAVDEMNRAYPIYEKVLDGKVQYVFPGAGPGEDAPPSGDLAHQEWPGWPKTAYRDTA